MKFLNSRKTAVVLVTLILCVFALGAFADSQLRNDKETVYHDLEIFAKIIEKVKLYYVDDVDSHELIDHAINSMLKELDPHSNYLSGLDYEDLMVSTRGEFGGLGIFISFRDNYPTVISPIDDTPAERAGIRGGDQIVEIEGQATEGWRTDKAVGLLRGAPGTTVRFKVSRPGETDAIEYVITREVINVKSVPYAGIFENHTGYIKVSNFAKNTAEELSAAIDNLESQGMTSLVLDFRTNPGGLLETSREVAELFLEKDKLVVFTKGRLPNANRKYYSHNRDPHGGYPIVVMINGASASASEIFAGALQDWDAAFVVGQTSFGKGTVQTVFNLSDTEAVKLTTAKYYTPSGRSIHKDEKTREAEMAAIEGHDGDEGMSDVDPEGMDESGDKAGDKEPDATTADVTDTNSEKPVYYTSSGRIVYGGGGITPDLEFEPEVYTDLQRRLERDALAFSFAVDYLTHNDVSEDLNVTDEMVDEFLKFAKGRDFEYKQEDLTPENMNYIRMMLRRELASNKFGRQAAYRVVTAADPEFLKVVDILKQAHDLSALFQYAEQQKSIKKASNE